jgi:hypothetical protein
MTSIYRCAYSVVGWLGPESSHSKVAFSTLDQIGSQTVFRVIRIFHGFLQMLPGLIGTASRIIGEGEQSGLS